MLYQPVADMSLHQLVGNRHTGTLKAPVKPINTAHELRKAIKLRVLDMAQFLHQFHFVGRSEMNSEIPAVDSIPHGFGTEDSRSIDGAVKAVVLEAQMNRPAAAEDDCKCAPPSFVEDAKVPLVLASDDGGWCFRPLDKPINVKYSEAVQDVTAPLLKVFSVFFE